MTAKHSLSRSVLLGLVLVVLGACAPAAQPSPTSAPAKPAPTAAPAKQESQPAATTVPAKPAATQAPAKQEAKPAASPAAKAAFDEKAVADFYRGKTVKIIVGFSPGGGYDTYARAIARHLGKYIPGNPTVIVENMPGAGSIVATNAVYATQPKDGTVIGHFSGANIGQQLFGNTSIEFDAAKFHYVGAPVADTAALFVTRQSGFTSLDQMLGPNGKELILGGTAPGSMNVDAPALLVAALDARIKVVQGFQGSSDVRLAMERGELDGFFNAWESTKITNLEDIQNGNWLTLFQMVEQRHRELPDVPAIPDVARTEEQRQLLRYGYAIPGQFARPFVVAPEVPRDRVLALQSAFAEALEDKEFLADAEKSKLSLGPLSGDQLQRLVLDYLAMPADLKGKLQKILVPGA